MSPRVTRAVAWTAWVLSATAIGYALILSTRYPPTSSLEAFSVVDDALWSSSWLGFGFVGALIVSQRSRNRIGWVLCGITFGLAITIFGPTYARASLLSGGLPLAGLAAWLGTWTFVAAAGLVIALVLLFPSGTLTTRRQHWLARLLIVLVIADVGLYAVRPGPVEGDAPPDNPLGIATLDPVFDSISGVVGVVLTLVALLVVADAIARYRRAEGVERQQFRWFSIATASFPLLFFMGIAAESLLLGERGFDPVPIAFLLCGNGLAAAIGVAVTRHGLYEISRIVSRSVSYLLLSATLLGIYAVSVTVLTAATAPVTGDSPVAVAAATLLAAAAFSPARRGIQRRVDRRFNRARYDAGVTVDAYRARLRDEVEMVTLTRDLLQTVAVSMQPQTVSLWLSQTSTHSRDVLPGTAAVTVPERRGATRGT